MADTKPDLIERAQETLPRRRRGMWLWVLVAVVAAGVLAAVLLWPDGDEAPVLSEEPPYGLTAIDMPKTGDEMVAVLERMPAIDGRQPTFMEEEGIVFYEGTESEGPGLYRSIQVLPADDPPRPNEFAEAIQETLANAQQSETVTVEASALDPNGDLMWAVISDEETQDGIPAFYMVWAEPNGSWFFYLSGDSADFRVKLVHAFSSAVGD